MPDISMCEGTGCPRAATCHRATATPSEHRQAYFAPPPIKADGSCQYYWPTILRTPVQTRPARAVTCETCDDTHAMYLSGAVVMCTRCPTPCQDCRSGGNGPYCETTPCACGCHRPKEGA